MISHHEAIESFKNAMFDNIGYAPDSIIGDGKLHRVKDTHGKLNGAYVLHLDNRPAGYIEDFKQGIKQNWKMEGAFMPLSQLQKQMQKAKHHKQEVERQQAEIAKHRESATKALYIWIPAPPAPANYPYSVKKHIGIHGARLGRGNTLIIPLTNSKNEIVNLQFISETGGKRFLSGGQKKGCFYILAGNTDKILICEGFATGASLFESCGFMTVVAFDAGNLKEVAINIRALYPKSEIVIAGDNDLSGVGQKKAIEAALAINGKYIIPATPGHDWNDSLTMEVQNA
ncbi:MAG: toprim domain-containing protein [Methylococcaceae bacterium]